MVIKKVKRILVQNQLVAVGVETIDMDNPKLLEDVPTIMVKMALFERYMVCHNQIDPKKYRCDLNPERVFAEVVKIVSCDDSTDQNTVAAAMLDAADEDEESVEIRKTYLEHPEYFEKFNKKYREGLLAILESPILIPKLDECNNEHVITIILPNIEELKKNSLPYRRSACKGFIQTMTCLLGDGISNTNSTTFRFNDQEEMGILLDGNPGYCARDIDEALATYIDNFSLLNSQNHSKKILGTMKKASKESSTNKEFLKIFVSIHENKFKEAFDLHPEYKEVFA